MATLVELPPFLVDARYPGFGHFVGISFNGCKHAEVEDGFPTSPNFLKVKREPSTSAGFKRLVRTAALLVRAAKRCTAGRTACSASGVGLQYSTFQSRIRN